MTDAVSGETGQCEFDSVKYYCVIPYVGWSWSGTMTVEANMDVCGSDKGVFYFAELVDDLSPYYHDLVLVGPGEKCPLIEPTPVKGTQ